MDERYIARARKYMDGLNTLGDDADVWPFMMTVDFDAAESECRRYHNIRFHRMPSAIPAKSADNCEQHGAFTPYLPLPDDAVVVFTDADIVVQRFPTGAELEQWERIAGTGKTLMTFNAGLGDTLYDEACRLRPQIDWDEIEKRFPGNLKETPCHNGGVIVASFGTFKKMYADVCERWELAGQTFDHIAKLQWIINYCCATCGYPTEMMMPSTHLHLHYGMPYGGEERDGVGYWDGGVSLFYHKPIAHTGEYH